LFKLGRLSFDDAREIIIESGEAVDSPAYVTFMTVLVRIIRLKKKEKKQQQFLAIEKMKSYDR